MKIKILLSFIFYLSYSGGLIAQRSEVQGGEYKVPKHGECLLEYHRLRIKQALDANVRSLLQQGKLEMNPSRNLVLFEFPMQWNIPTDAYSFYAISNYVDHDPSFQGFIEDYNCGDRSYDTDGGYNHRGIDYYLWPFSWNLVEEDAVKIVAAADGVIVGRDEGNQDQSCSLNGSQWNAVYVRHADGSTSWYGHMKKNSVTTKQVGDNVVAGEYLGIVGSSGNSTAPHLHFETYDSNDDLIDPYEGPCNQWNEDSWWIDQRPYIDPAILRIQTHFAPPDFNPCPQPDDINEQNEFQPGDRVFFVTYFRDQQNWHPCKFRIRMPTGQLYDAWTFNSPHQFLSSAYWYWFFDLSTNVIEGTWTFECDYLGNVYTHDFFVGDVSSVDHANENIQKFSVQSDLQEVLVLVDCELGFEGNLVLTDLTGRIIQQEDHDFNSGNNVIRMSAEALPMGLYMVTLTSREGAFLKTIKMVR